MKLFTGLNIQFPISRLILGGGKTVETRTYPIPAKYLGQELLIIETPGKEGNFKSRLVGSVIFNHCFKYLSESKFYADSKRHFVTPDSQWKWTDQKPKWGWEILKINRFEQPIPAPQRRGIIYTTNISI